MSFKSHVARLCGPVASPNMHLHEVMPTKLHQVDLACAEDKLC